MERIAHYEIVRRLGRGGMGEVVEAVDLDLGRRVALKFVVSAAADDPEAQRRFEREARAAAALHHPRIATLFAFDRTTERPFLVMELLAGRTLRDVLAGGALPVAEALAIARDVAEGLAFAHAHGVVHRDIKPGNLMFDGAGAIKITDFGLARSADASLLTITGASLGTPTYMAPESLRDHASGHPDAGSARAGAPADVFALGVTLHEMLAGTPPFGGEHVLGTLYAIANLPPRRLVDACPEVPPAVERLVTRMLEKDPAARPTAEEVARELAALTGSPAAAPHPAAARASAAHAAADSAASTAPMPSDRSRATTAPLPGGVPAVRTEDLSAERLGGVPAAGRAEGGGVPARRAARRARPVLWMALALVAMAAVTLPWIRGRQAADRARRAVVLINQGHDSLATGRLAAARERFEAALALTPGSGQAKLNLAIVLERAGEPDRAARLFGEVIREQTAEPALRAAAEYGLGGIDLEARAFPSAIAHLMTATRADSTRVEYANNLGFALIQAGRTEEALAALGAARARFPGEPALRKNEALAWLQAGHADSAAVAAREAVRLRPDYAEAWSLKARSEAALGDRAGARSSLETLRRLAPPAPLLAETEAALRTTMPAR